MFSILAYVRDPKTPLKSRILDMFKDPYITFRFGILDRIEDLCPNKHNVGELTGLKCIYLKNTFYA